MWERIYENGAIHTNPSLLVSNLIETLRARGARTILDAGCGAGRH